MAHSRTRRHTRSGISLVELLIVVAILGILVRVVVPAFDPGVVDQLQSAATVFCSDIDYARGLAISNNSLYTVTFEIPNNRYFVYHTGLNDALDALPRSPFLVDNVDAVIGPRQIADFDDLLTMGPLVKIYDVRRQTGGAAVTSVEFNPLGNTTATDGTVVYLTCGEGNSKRYLPITISAVTGIAEIGDPRITAP